MIVLFVWCLIVVIAARALWEVTRPSKPEPPDVQHFKERVK